MNDILGSHPAARLLVHWNPMFPERRVSSGNVIFQLDELKKKKKKSRGIMSLALFVKYC